MIQQWPAEFADRYRQAGYWTDETFPSMLASRAMSDPGKLAVVDERVRWSYAELYSRAERIAAGLLRLGLARGDRVVVQLPNRAELIAVIFGLFRAGMIPVMSLPSHRRAEISHFASASGARGYVITDVHDGFDYRVLARELCRANALLEHVIVVGDAEEFTSLNDVVKDVINDGGNDGVLRQRYDVDPFEVALVQISGGSGGRSKLIPRTTADYLYSARASVPICGVTSESVYLTALPAAHNFPVSSPGWLGVLHAGGTVVLATLRAADDAFSWIARERVTHVGLVPPLALLWLEAVGNTTYGSVAKIGGSQR